MPVQNACLPSISGPLPSNTVYMGVPPTAKQWTVPKSLKDHVTLRLSCGTIFCFNVAWLLMSVAMSLLPVAAVVVAIYAMPVDIAERLAKSTGACNSPAYKDAYHITSYDLRQVLAGMVAWCDDCSIGSFLNEMSSRVNEQADPARAISAAQISPQRVHFDDDTPNIMPRCFAFIEWCPEALLLLRNTSLAEAGALPLCVMNGLLECNKQAVVAVFDWVPSGDLLPPLICAHRSAKQLLTAYSWREPLEALQSCTQLMLASIAFYIACMATVIIWKHLLVGRFRSGVWDFWDVRSNEWIRQNGGAGLNAICERDFTLSRALNGSQWRVILYRLAGMRVGKRVFVDRDVVFMGARSCRVANYHSCRV